MFMLVAASFLLFGTRAIAQDIPVPVPTGVDNFVGLGVVSVPDYEGSNDYTVAAAPILQFKFSSKRYFQLLGNKAYLNILNNKNWEFGPIGIYRIGRKDVDDEIVKLMADVDDSAELGLFIGYRKTGANPRYRGNIHLDLSQDISDGHGGFVATLAATYWRPISMMFDIGIRANATYAGDEYMSSFFDVSAADSAASGLPIYSAGSGMKDVGVALMTAMHLSRNWHIGGGVFYKALLGDASDSPVVDQRGSSDQYFIGGALLYSW